jgi:nucleotide-binding universal stress UspA family protein
MLSRILVPVVFSERCELAARYGAALARRFGSEIVLLHVFNMPSMAFPSPEGYAIPPQTEIDAWVNRSRERLEQFLAPEWDGLPVRRLMSEGDPAREIVRCSQVEQCELIVMPTHGYGPFRRFLLGSVTAKVLHDATCAVFTGPHLEHAPAGAAADFRRLLCAIDFGPQSNAIVEQATRFAAEFHSEVTLLHVLPNEVTRLEGVYFDPQWRCDLIAAARRHMEDMQAALGTKHHVRVEAGDVSHLVRDVAHAENADLVWIGRGHPHGLLGRLRTNAYAILRESPCPVLAV